MKFCTVFVGNPKTLGGDVYLRDKMYTCVDYTIRTLMAYYLLKLEKDNRIHVDVLSVLDCFLGILTGPGLSSLCYRKLWMLNALI